MSGPTQGNFKSPEKTPKGLVPAFMMGTTDTEKFGTMACSSNGVDRASLMSTMTSRLSPASRMML